jgi:hypothetical protein
VFLAEEKRFLREINRLDDFEPQAKLAEASKVATKTVADFEREVRTPYDRTMADIRRALESAGVEFTNDDQPGVRLRKGT